MGKGGQTASSTKQVRNPKREARLERRIGNWQGRIERQVLLPESYPDQDVSGAGQAGAIYANDVGRHRAGLENRGQVEGKVGGCRGADFQRDAMARLERGSRRRGQQHAPAGDIDAPGGKLPPGRLVSERHSSAESESDVLATVC